MAADGSIGGFSGQWGEGCKINKKRSLLQSEGVQFDAKTGKIVKECLLASIPPAATFDDDDDDDNLDSRKQVAKTTSTRPTKKQKTEKSGDDNTTSKYFAVTKKKKADGSKESSSNNATNNVDVELRDITLQMIGERAAGKTC